MMVSAVGSREDFYALRFIYVVYIHIVINDSNIKLVHEKNKIIFQKIGGI